MGKEEKLTKKQHFIPETYLQGFSNNGVSVHRYDLKECKRSKEAIPIDTICWKKYLYELRAENNELVWPNYLEDLFCELEGAFATHKRLLERKIDHLKRPYSEHFLSVKERTFWIMYVTIQSQRLPNSLERTKEFAKIYFGEELTDVEARNIALKTSIPLFEEIKDGGKNNILCVLAQPLYKMNFAIGYDKMGRLLTSDNPAYIRGSKEKFVEGEYFAELDECIFPISSHLCLVILCDELAKHLPSDNSLFELGEDEIERINWSVSYMADRFIFAPNRIDQSTVNMIRNAHLDKKGTDIEIDRIWSNPIIE